MGLTVSNLGVYRMVSMALYLLLYIMYMYTYICIHTDIHTSKCSQDMVEYFNKN